MPHPWLSRNIVFRLQERLLQRPTFAYLESLERSQWFSREDVERLQMQKLTRLLDIAANHSPWHAARIQASGTDVGEGRPPLTLQELRRLPTMTREDARLNVERIRWANVPGGARRYNTGGSTGEPLIFYFGRSRQASDAAGRIRARRWWGVDIGDREVYLWGAPTELSGTDRIKMLRDRLLNQLMLNAFAMSAAGIDRYLDAIQVFRPKCIYGYASSVALLAARASMRGLRLRLPELRVVCTTGEPLYPHQRQLIQEVFRVPVASEFGSRDVGFIAHEAPRGEMLLTSESTLLEVLDEAGQPVAPGELGEAVATGLCSEAQPFIRYRTGDMVRVSAHGCPEGRGLHVLSEVVGRTTDFVVRPDGVVMHALAIIYVLRAVEGVGQFKVIQHALRDLEVLVLPERRWTEASHARVMAGLAERLGDEVRVNIRLVNAIPIEASGKYRYVVSHVPPQGGLEQEMRMLDSSRAS